MFNTLVALVLSVQFAPTAAAPECKPTDLRTPSVYLYHVGDSDKPIFPIVIAETRPKEQELRCALPGMWFSAEVFVVTEEELAKAVTLVKQSGSDDDKAGFSGFLYLVVSKPAATETGLLDLVRSKRLFGDLAAYFSGREPRLHDQLKVTMRRF